jgi:ribosomal peptide maturation radical SAM protein 1
MRQQQIDVLLINMPFAALFRPSLGLSLLKSAVTASGLSAKCLYFTVPFGQRIGSKLYARIANQEPRTTDLVGEWIFSNTLFDGDSPEPFGAGYIDDILRRRVRFPSDNPPERTDTVSEHFIQEILHARSMAADFIRDSVDEVLSYAPKIVGFTSVFQQQVSSLSVAKRIKTYSPETYIVFGGANCEGVMGAELARLFPFVDAVVSGEGDLVFPEIVRRVLDNRSVSDVRGVYTRENVESVLKDPAWRAAPVRNLDQLPWVDFDDFFERHNSNGLDRDIQREILFETSRGCWWGQKSHCTFCGLSDESMVYRSKSPARALDEITDIAGRYPGCPVIMVDDILDLKYFKDFVPQIAARNLNLELFYETKANLKKDQVRLMREAGITSIQPGIESFSTRVLALMGKGVKALQNIQVLKWCKEFGIRPYWNILWGFPREDPDDYAGMAKLIPLITHLPAPESAGKIRLDRFSPNFEHSERFGFTSIHPYPAYFHVYPFDQQAVANLAYFFTYDVRERSDLAGYTRPVWDEVVRWWKSSATSDLFFVDKGSQLLIWDLRPVARKPLTVLAGLQRILYIACDSARSLSDLHHVAEENCTNVIKPDELPKLLEPMVDHGLMIRDNQSYLSLAIPLGIYTPAAPVIKRFEETLSLLGKSSGDEVIVPLDPSFRI